MGDRVTIRDARPDELASFGEALVTVNSGLEGFPSRSEQPQYHELLDNFDRHARKPDASALVAVALDEGVHADDRSRRSLIPISTVASGRLRWWTGRFIRKSRTTGRGREATDLASNSSPESGQ